jgi:hypothetical protein
VAGALARAETYLRVGPADRPAAVPRSYLPDGRRVGWHGPMPPGWSVALDAELGSAPVPPRLAVKFGEDRFWERWTRAESLCKVAGTPIATWIRRHRLEVPPLSSAVWRTLRLADVVVSVAMAPRTLELRG